MENRSFCGLVIAATMCCIAFLGKAEVEAADRMVLLELFTNDACPFCVSRTPALERLLADYGGSVAPVFYHVNWPDPADPFYALATLSVEGRLIFYQVRTIPKLFVDGIPLPESLRLESDDLDSLRALIDQRLALASPVTISFDSVTRPGVAGFDTTDVTVTFRQDGSLSSTDLGWQAAVVEFFVDRITGFGVGDSVRYGHVLGRMAPLSALEPLDLSGGQANGTVTFVREPDWEDGRIGLVVFVQDTSTQEVIQSATDFPRFDFRMPRQIGHSFASSSLQFDFELTNRGDAAASYEIFTTAADTVPVTTDLSADGATFRGDTLVLQLDAGVSKGVLLSAHVDPLPGDAPFRTNVRDASRPEVVWSRPTRALSGFRHLYVDDNNSAVVDTFYTSAFESALVGVTLQVGTWETVLGRLTQSDLDGVGTLFWATGTRFPGISEKDRAVLSGYLEGGGSLLLSGQDIGWEMADPESPFFSEESQRFYNEFMHAEFRGDNADEFELRGVAGDPISNNLVLNIKGGDGTNDQTSPDSIAVTSPAVSIFEYEPSRVGALRLDSGTYRLVYLAFGFEGINSGQIRRTLMSRIVSWLDTPAMAVAGRRSSGPPRPFDVQQNTPNPFNPQTRIIIRLPTSGRMRVTVFDLLGRRVATLANGPFAAGDHTLTFNARGLPSGIYFYEVIFGKEVRRHKMTLVR